MLAMLAVVSFPSSAFAFGAARREYLVPATIDGTGATDVTQALTAFIQHVPNHSLISFPRNKRYRIESILLIGNRTDLVIEGSGSTFFATTTGSGQTPVGPTGVRGHWPRHRSQWIVYDSSNIVVRDIVIVGANQRAGVDENAYVASLEAQSGFEFYRTKDSSLEGCNISYTYGDHIYIGHDSIGITVSHCTLLNSGRHSIAVTWARNVVLDANVISRIGRTAIDLEPNGNRASVTGVLISHNRIGVVRLNVIAAAGKGDVSNIAISGNHLGGQPLTVRNTPPAGKRRHDWQVLDNTSDTTLGSPHGSVWIAQTDGVNIQGNTQPLAARRPTQQQDVELPGCTRVTVAKNNFPRV
jgi:hypothetical protein